MRQSKGTTRRRAKAIEGDAVTERDDTIVVEEPLEIRVASDRVATTLRTPGSDQALALGFLLAEGVIQSRADVGSAIHCGRPGHPDQEDYGNTLDVLPGPGVALDPDAIDAARRTGLVSAACGACGRAEIERLLERVPPLPLPPVGPTLHPSLLVGLAKALRAGQTNFAQTGGLHAAAALNAQGTVVAHAEDIGRHNAVDKVVGRLLLDDALPDASRTERPVLLAVSGRSGFEIVQKAAVARFSALASISAASSLAIDSADKLGLTLAAFVREDRYTLYSHPGRFTHSPG